MSSLSTPSPFDPRLQHRLLTGCLLGSLALHAALLSLSPEFRYREQSTRFLTATLLRPAASERPAVQAVPESRPAGHREEARREVALAAPPVTPQAPAALAAPAPQAGVDESAVPLTPAPGVAEARPRSNDTEAANWQSTAPQSSVPAAAPDSGNVDQYRIALMGAAKRYRRYPSQAVENGWTGRVEVRLTVSRDGGVESVRVRNSSGYGILDDQALDMIRRAEGVTPIPPALQGRQFSIDIPVIFDLQTG